jgi:hypothetical protein
MNRRNGQEMIHTITSQHLSSSSSYFDDFSAQQRRKFFFNSFFRSAHRPFDYESKKARLRRRRISLHGVEETNESTGRRATFKFQLSS